MAESNSPASAAQRCIEHFDVFGEDDALASLLHSFPRLTFDNAKLWLAYMLDAREKQQPLKRFIMETFPRNDWFGLLRAGRCLDIAVRHLHHSCSFLNLTMAIA